MYGEALKKNPAMENVSIVANEIWYLHGMQQEEGQSAVIRRKCSGCRAIVDMAVDGQFRVDNTMAWPDPCTQIYPDLKSLVVDRSRIK
jgi:hypothetical protein